MTNAVIDWRKRARKAQNSFYNNLGDREWDVIETKYLNQKIGFGFFGCPKKIVKGILEHEEEQKKTISKICSKILSLHSGESINIAFIYVMFRIKGKDGKEGVQTLCKILDIKTKSNLFIDPTCRVYKGWEDYLQKNKLPRCDMCYPTIGEYLDDGGILDITFNESQACDTSSNILTGLDITSTVLTVAATGVTLASLAVPIATPFVMGAFGTMVATGTYDISRNVYKLYDIKDHCGSFGLNNDDARGAWLNLAGSTVGIASIGTTAVAKGITATAGTALERSSVIALRALNISAVAITGIGVANGLITLVLKLYDGTLNTQDILQFIQICFFFMNAIVSYDVAKCIISDMATVNVKDLHCVTRGTVKTRSMLEFKDTSNYQLLRNMVLGIQSRFMPTIDMISVERIFFQIIDFVDNLMSKNTDWEKFYMQVTVLLFEIWKNYKDTILKAMDEVGEVLGVKDWRSSFLQINANKLPPNSCSTTLSPDMAQQIQITSRQTALRCTNNATESNEDVQAIMEIGHNFNTIESGTDEMEYIHKFKYICEGLIQQYDLAKEQYETKLDTESSNSGFNKCKFDKVYGIDGTRRDFFFKKAVETLYTENKLQELLSTYYLDLAKGNIPPPSELLTAECSACSFYTFYKPVGKHTFEDIKYFEKACSLTKIDINSENAKLLKKGDFVFIQPSSKKQTYKAMLFYFPDAKETSIGQLLVIKNTETSDTNM